MELRVLKGFLKDEVNHDTIFDVLSVCTVLTLSSIFRRFPAGTSRVNIGNGAIYCELIDDLGGLDCRELKSKGFDGS